MEEKDLKNFEGLYTINTQGEVRRKETNIVLNYRWTKGSPFVRVSKEGKRKDVFIISTLAEHFIPNPHGYKYTILKNKTAPITVENIEWSENKPLKEIPVGKIIKGFKVVEDLGIQNKKRLVKTECTGCGKIEERYTVDLRNKKYKFCGCKQNPINIKRINNRILKREDTKRYIVKELPNRVLLTKCRNCGGEYKQKYDNFISASSGCKLCRNYEHVRTHNLSGHPLYKKYVAIKMRCYNESEKSYKYYGGKGIKMCDEWLEDFKAFYDWAISSGWEHHLTIERKDNFKNYSPDNCTWATRKEQNRNQTHTKLSMKKAEKIRESTLSVKELTLKYKVSEATIYSVLNNDTWA